MPTQGSVSETGDYLHTRIISLLLMLAAVLGAFAQEALTNESVVKMVKSGLAEQVIVEAINQAPGNYKLSPDDLISLKAGGTPDAVIAAMLAKAKASQQASPQSTAARVARAKPIVRGACTAIEVERFDVQPGIDFPGDHLSALMGDIITQLSQTHKFQTVVPQGEKPADSTVPCMRLTGTVVRYKKGSRSVRYLAGPGAALAGLGKTLVKAHVRFVASGTGDIVHEQDVDGKVWIGAFGGSSSGASRGMGKEVAKVAKKALF